MSLLGVMALTAGYELVREASRQYEDRLARKMEGMTRKFLEPLLDTDTHKS